MIVIPPGLARSFRAAARRCSTGRPKGPAPPVLVAAGRGRLTLTCVFPEVVLAFEAAHPTAAVGTLVVPASLLDAADPASPLELTADGPTCVAKWAGRDGPHETAFDADPPDRPRDPPAFPRRTAAVAPTFLTALHECGRVTGKDPTRFAVNRLNIRGSAGEVAGTDCQQALLWGGFAFPFPEDVLVPAVPVFGCKCVAAEADVRVGRTGTHLGVAAGPWRVLLEIDPYGKFPDVRAVVPRAVRTTVADLAGADADRLLDFLSRQPKDESEDDDGAAVTLAADADGVRVLAAAAVGVDELPLAASAADGPRAAVALNPDHLRRAVTLGLRRVRVAAADKPVVFLDGDRTYLTMTRPARRVLATTGDESTPGDSAMPTTPEPRTAKQETPMTPATPPGRPDPPGDPTDPLAEAEALKAALADAAHQAHRLVQSLKSGRRQKRQLETAWTALRALNLDPGGRP